MFGLEFLKLTITTDVCPGVFKADFYNRRLVWSFESWPLQQIFGLEFSKLIITTDVRIWSFSIECYIN